ncbi:CDP-alcohol phosphatidyltransferase family protein [Fulvimarina sp. MAC8]|uniref:CDP-alcohol phosphatidyltransferase family protein n=1 Tax=Fulvimarina sp. MAC8 TaxID=3162874 RepID=UPI0032F018F2
MQADQNENAKAEGARRPLASRQTGWASAALRILLKTGLSANQISFIGIIFSAIGAAAMLYAPGMALLWLLGALCIQLRLMANMMDGLVAVEGGKGGPTGAIWNEAPDRIEDSLFLVAFGYAIGFGWLGWLAALLAALAAYTRLLGGTLGLPQDFVGPMAKPHRMAALTLGCVIAFGETMFTEAYLLSAVLLFAIALGTAYTIARRLMRQSKALTNGQGRR